MNNENQITIPLVEKLIHTVNAGLCFGKGIQEPGKMCVEAAVCYAYGLPHGDNPPCVGSAVRAYKIMLNDSNWSSDQARGKGMLALSIAQLNSIEIDQVEFARMIVLKHINTIVADIAKKYLPAKEAEFRAVNDLDKARLLCDELAESAAKYSKSASEYAEYAKYAAKYAAKSASESASESAEYAKYAAESAESAESAEYAAESAESAEYAAKSASESAESAAKYSKSAKITDGILNQAAQNCLEVLKEMKSPGCEFLYLIK